MLKSERKNFLSLLFLKNFFYRFFFFKFEDKNKNKDLTCAENVIMLGREKSARLISHNHTIA